MIDLRKHNKDKENGLTNYTIAVFVRTRIIGICMRILGSFKAICTTECSSVISKKIDFDKRVILCMP